MNTKGLSLNTIPPITIPLRFFLTAPLFGILAALLMLSYGTEMWQSRWHANSLAMTHLLTIGFMLMVMIGALYQFIPVMMGQLIPGCQLLVPIIHPFLIIGTITLAAGFLTQLPILYWLALITLSAAVILFAASLIPLLISRLREQLIVYLLRILYFVLLVTIGLGLYMLLAYGWPGLGIVVREYTNIHALWGLIGWVVLLIMAVSSQVIPMFFVTPDFSVRLLKLLSLLIVSTLVFMSLFNNIRDILADLVLTLELLLFLSYFLWLLKHRKRKLPDVTINFFYLSLVSLLLAICLWWWHYLWPDWFHSFRAFEFTLAILLIYGLAISAIIGMLQKIVPFLIFLHLQRLSFGHPGSIEHIPNMKKIISSRNSQVQFFLYLFSLIILLVCVYLPGLVWLSGLLILANFTWLFFCMFQGFRMFQYHKLQILTYPKIKLNC